MNAIDIIAKKRDGKKLTAEEIDFLVYGYTSNQIPDYQMSAWLMAIYQQGMDAYETAYMTKSMLFSGERINLSRIPGPKIDKHSTGGVGDKVSIVLAPLMAAAGLRVPMISGRGLGHSGGTLDKLEAIPGFRTKLTADEFYEQVEQIGVAMIGQTDHLVPADKKIYALRDATATIGSIPLITSSIISKKLAEGIDGLVLDVKMGRGAFMKSYAEAVELAKSLIQTAALNKLAIRVLITNMDQPLGYAVGNWLETREAIMTLKGRGPADVMILTLALGANMLIMSGKATDPQKAMEALRKLIYSEKAYEKFAEMVVSQGGDISYLLDPGKYPMPKIKYQIRSSEEGYVSGLDALEIGRAVVKLGGGRNVIEDQIDFGAGIVLNKKIGDKVAKGDLLALLYTDRDRVLSEVIEQVKNAFAFSPEKVESPKLILKALAKM